MEELYITRIALKNFRCFGEFALEPGQVTIVQGANGVGKSTILEAVRAVFDGGWCDEWIKSGESEAEVELNLSSGVTVKLGLKAVTSKRSKPIRIVEITAADGSEIKAPQTYLRQLATGIAYDPAQFLLADAKERAKYIAQFLNVQLTAAEIVEAAGADWVLEHYRESAAPFDRLKLVRDAIYTKRTKVNSEAEEKRGFVQTLRKDIPTLNDDPAEVEDEFRAATSEVTALATESATAYQEIEAARKVEVDSIWMDKQKADEEARQVYEQALLKHQIAAADAEKKTFASFAASLKEAEARYEPKKQEAKARAMAAQQRRDALLKAQGTLDKVNEMDSSIKALAGESIRLTTAIERLDDLKKAKLAESDLPEGVEIVDGIVHVDGRPFDTGINTARKIEVAIQLAAKNPGKLKLFLLDDAEHLAPAVFSGLVDAVREAGFQMVAVRVEGDGDLKLASVA